MLPPRLLFLLLICQLANDSLDLSTCSRNDFTSRRRHVCCCDFDDRCQVCVPTCYYLVMSDGSHLCLDSLDNVPLDIATYVARGSSRSWCPDDPPSSSGLSTLQTYDSDSSSPPPPRTKEEGQEETKVKMSSSVSSSPVIIIIVVVVVAVVIIIIAVAVYCYRNRNPPRFVDVDAQNRANDMNDV